MKNSVFQSSINDDGAALGKAPELREAASLVQTEGRIPASSPIVLSPEAIIQSLKGLEQVRDGSISEVERRRPKHHPVTAETLLNSLKNVVISPQLTGLRSPETAPLLFDSVQLAIDNGRPLVFVLLAGGGKVPNALKTRAQSGPDLADATKIAMLSGFARGLSNLHKPGVQVVVVPDLGLHTADIGAPIERYLNHMQGMQDLTNFLASNGEVVVLDPLTILPDSWADEVDRVAAGVRSELKGKISTGMMKQAESLTFSINTSRFGWSEHESLLAFASVAGVHPVPLQDHERATRLRRHAMDILPHYVAVNQAIRNTGLAELAASLTDPDAVYVRMSVHAKPNEVRPKLVPVGKLAPLPGLLPMHAVGVRSAHGGKLRHGLVFDLVAKMRGWTPMLKPDGTFWYYDPDPS